MALSAGLHRQGVRHAGALSCTVLWVLLLLGQMQAAAVLSGPSLQVHLLEDCNLCAIHAKRVTISERGEGRKEGSGC